MANIPARYINHIPSEMKRKGDIYRILYARGQENDYSVDELYSLFENMSPQKLRKARHGLEDTRWHLTPPEERQHLLYGLTDVMGLSDVFLIGNFVFPKRNIPLANPLDLCYNISVKLKKWKVCYDRKL